MDPATFVARHPVDLLALAPILIGFHPRDSVVLLTFGAPRGSFHARVDLPLDAEDQAEVADLLAAAAQANAIRVAAVLLYTDDEEVAASQARLVIERLVAVDVGVIDAIRVEEDRYFVLLEDDPGTPFDVSTHPFTVQRVFEGQVVHGSRDELADTLVGTDEADALAVEEAAAAYDARVRARLDDGAGPAQPLWPLLAEEGRWVQRRIRAWLADPVPLSAEDAGRLLVLMALVPVRDVAWSEIAPAEAGAHVRLWRELVRRAPAELLPGASGLLGFAAWLAGDGALAWCAVDRCLQVDPDYSLAHRLGELLTAAVNPRCWTPVPEADLPVFRPGLGEHVPRGAQESVPGGADDDPGGGAADRGLRAS